MNTYAELTRAKKTKIIGSCLYQQRFIHITSNGYFVMTKMNTELLKPSTFAKQKRNGL